jgi:spore germination cell wall hydrolase CwlJ-like protein
LKSVSQATADWRVLACAALVGSGVGMSLGAAYMAGGMAQVAADYHASRFADARFSDSMGAASVNIDPQIRALQAANTEDSDVATAGLANKSKATRDLDCLTQAVYFEARGETPRGQAAVAQVVMNRVKSPSFPKSVCGVVFQGAAAHRGCQFSFACDGSMRQAREDDAWDRARKIARRTLSGVVLADIGSATHFHTTGVAPSWGPQMLRVAQVGLHVFYRFNPHAPAMRPMDGGSVVLASLSTANPPTGELRLSQALVDKSADAKAAPVAASATAAAVPAAAQVSTVATEPKAMPKLPDAPPAGLSKAADTAPATAPKPTTSAS